MIQIGPDIARILADKAGEDRWYVREGVGVYRVTEDPTGDWPVFVDKAVFVDKESDEEDMELIAMAPAMARTLVQLHKDRDQLQDTIEELDRAYERERKHSAHLEAEVDRLRDWLIRIEGGDHPCEDAEQLRRWAYEAATLSRDPVSR